MRSGTGVKLALAVATILAAAPMAAQAEVAGGVIGCDASGDKQAAGALVGALLGGVVGSNLAKNDKMVGTVVGAGAGAAAGSYVGCSMQKSAAARAEAQAAPEPYAEAYESSPGRDHRMPPGQGKKYFGVGERLPVAYVSEPRHYLTDPRRYGLRYAPSGHRWVVLDGDAYLVRSRTGTITDVARDVFG